MSPRANIELSVEQRREVAAWIQANSATLPESVRRFLAILEPCLQTEGDPLRALNVAHAELRRALHITPSSEKRRSSGSPLAGAPLTKLPTATSEQEKVVAQIDDGRRLAGWHIELHEQHTDRVKRLEEKLAKMPKDESAAVGGEQAEDVVPRLEDIERTDEQRAKARATVDRFIAHLQEGDGADPAMKSVNETLMPAGAVLVREEDAWLPAELPEELADAQVVKTIVERRVRYDFAVPVTRCNLDIEKKVVVDQDGERSVISPSTAHYGPPRYAVTWEALATLAILVAQFAMPFNRLATMFSTPLKRFTASALSRMLHYVAERFVPIYLELASQLSNSEVLAGDDTSCRVLEVSRHFAQTTAPPEPRPWADYQTPRAAEESFARCERDKEPERPPPPRATSLTLSGHLSRTESTRPRPRPRRQADVNGALRHAQRSRPSTADTPPPRDRPGRSRSHHRPPAQSRARPHRELTAAREPSPPQPSPGAPRCGSPPPGRGSRR